METDNVTDMDMDADTLTDTDMDTDMDRDTDTDTVSVSVSVVFLRIRNVYNLTKHIFITIPKQARSNHRTGCDVRRFGSKPDL